MPRGPVDRARRRRAALGWRWVSLSVLLLVSACTIAQPGSASQSAGRRHPNTNRAPQSQPAPPAASGQWRLTWDEEFNKPSDLQGWSFVTSGNGGGLHQLQWYDANNATISSGDLVVTASRDGGVHRCWYGLCKYRSARLNTLGTFAQAYGRFEARIKFPPGRGFWPAFWLEGTDITSVGWPASGEIDVVEPRMQYPDIVQGWAHAPAPLGAVNKAIQVPDDISSGFHVYGIDWTPQAITWTFDGYVYGRMKYYPGWPFDQPFFLILNLAVGGGYSGSLNAQTHFPAHMLVDWIRVYRHV